MSRGFKILCLVTIASLALSSCGKGGDGGTDNPSQTKKTQGLPKFDQKSTMAAIQKRGKLIVGMPLNEYPFAYRDENTGSLAGFDVLIANHLAQGIFGAQIEDRVEFLDIDPRDRELSLESNKVDIAMSRYEITVARKKFVDFAGPYYMSKQVALKVKAKNDKSASLLDLANKKVCTVQGSTDIEALKVEAPGVDVSLVKDTIQECGVVLKAGGVEAVVADEVDAQPLIRDSSLVILGGKSFDPKPYGIGIHKGNLDFRTFINDRLDNQTGKVWNDLFSRSVGQTGAKGTRPPVDRY